MPERIRRSLPIVLRGNRNYLHGTDLFDSMYRATAESLGTSELKDIRARFPRFFFQPLDLELTEESPARDSEWECAAGSKKIYGKLIATPNPPPLIRIPFHEERIFQKVMFSADRAILNHDPALSMIEHIVFLCKALHLRLAPPASHEQWVFSRIELERNFSLPHLGFESLSVQLMARLGDFFTRSEIFAGPARMGEIFFYKVKREQAEATQDSP